MPEYRYYSADVLTGDVLAELPLYGVWCTRKMSEAGECTASLRLGTGMYDDMDLLDATEPGKTVLYVERNGTLVWGGIFWSRTWQEDALVMNMTGQTWESVFSHVCFEQNVIQQDVDQMVIFKSMIDQMQLQDYNNFGFDTSGIGTCGVNKTVLIPGYEYHKVQEGVDQIVGADDGIDYTIDLLPGAVDDVPRKYIRVGYPNIGGNAQIDDSLMFDYPGDIENFWYSENASQSGTIFVGIGAGAGEAMLRTKAISRDQLDNGWPGWYSVVSHKNTTDTNILQSQTRADRDKYKSPIVNPTFNIRSDRTPEFTAFGLLGQNLMAHIESARFPAAGWPNGKDVVSRMIGWELTPETSDAEEQITLTLEDLEGPDDA